ncbi:hypothetical protein [Parasitella parasitica]|uniref:RING-CH-type domain-containing protein n=1 Tax=Parasitella parasitica TaxID=35722 RepID=A0A0B7NRN5_9FUNG|nr:hypothetical protein [Parasitella parasitica]
MSHFRCPSSSLVEEAGLYEYQPISGLDESQLLVEDEEYSSNNTSRSTSSANITIIQNHNNIAASTSVNAYSNNNSKRCWICFGEETDSEGRWVNPCQCSLVSHEQCLLDWIAETQKNIPLKRVSCPQCNSIYMLSETHSIPLVFMSIADSLVNTAAPYITVLGLGCSMLITSTTFGAYTVLTLFGTKEGEKLIGNPAYWTWRTWLGLPSIPVALIASRSKWSDTVLPAATLLLLRITGISHLLKMTWPPSPAVVFGLLPWVRLLYNNIYSLLQKRVSQLLIRNNSSINSVNANENHRPSQSRRTRMGEIDIEDNTDRRADQDTEVLFGREGRDMSVTVIGALLWPTISSIIGSYLSHSKFVRRYFPETFQRNVLGGCIFVAAKDIANLFYRYERIRRHRSRKIVNYNDIKRRSK